MSVTHIFVATTIIASAEVNQNYTDCEDGTAMDNVTNDIAMANNTKIYFKNLAGVNDCLIHEDISDNLVLKLGTAGKYTIFKKHDGEVVFQIDTPIGAVYTRKGYAFRVYDVTNTKYLRLVDNGADSYLASASAGHNLYLTCDTNGDVVILGRIPFKNNATTSYVNRHMQFMVGIITTTGGASSVNITFPKAYSSADWVCSARVVGIYTGVAPYPSPWYSTTIGGPYFSNPVGYDNAHVSNRAAGGCTLVFSGFSGNPPTGRLSYEMTVWGNI